MAVKPALRDSRLIDALEGLPHRPFSGTVWRVVREGRDPLQCSASGGRWDDGTFEVLYTSYDRDGAIAEMYFHVLRGQPVFPSRQRFCLYELTASMEAVMVFSSLEQLEKIGFNTSRYGQLSYAERDQEYPRSQEIAEVAHFLDCDGLVVPSARWDCSNLVIFCDRTNPGAIVVEKDHGVIDWTAWQKTNKAKF